MVGEQIEKNPNSNEIIKRLAKEGHAIGNHSYSHRYDLLYPDGKVDVEYFMEEIDRTENLLKDILGKDFKTRVVRLPGGAMSWDTSELLPYMNERGYGSVDWNSLNGDSEGGHRNQEKLLDRLKETVGDKENVVVLMHDKDGKENTYNYLQDAINYLKSEGFEFRTIK